MLLSPSCHIKSPASGVSDPVLWEVSTDDVIWTTRCFIFNMSSYHFCLLTSSYRQAQATVLAALPLLNKHSIATKRPDDYFAEMAKTDQHMQKVSFLFSFLLFFLCSFFFFFIPSLSPSLFEIFTNKNDSFVQIRKKLLAKQTIMERSEKAKKLREQRKYGKKVCVCFSYFCPFVFLLNRINFKKVELQDCTRLYWEWDCNSFKPFVTPKWHPYKTVRMGWK